MKFTKGEKRAVWFTLDMLVVAVVVLGVAAGIYRTVTTADSPCQTPGDRHTLLLDTDKFNTQELKVKQCDTITIVNNDADQPYRIAMGVHDEHIEYPSFTIHTLYKGDSISFDALEAGTYQLHDHIRDKAKTQLRIRALQK